MEAAKNPWEMIGVMASEWWLGGRGNSQRRQKEAVCRQRGCGSQHGNRAAGAGKWLLWIGERPRRGQVSHGGHLNGPEAPGWPKSRRQVTKSTWELTPSRHPGPTVVTVRCGAECRVLGRTPLAARRRRPCVRSRHKQNSSRTSSAQARPPADTVQCGTSSRRTVPLYCVAHIRLG